MERRGFMLALAVGALAATSGCGQTASTSGLEARPLDLVPPPDYSIAPGHPPALISALPGHTNSIALTIDDGTDPAVVQAYAEFVKSANLRLTFFVNGLRPSWTDHADVLRPLVDAGQVQLGNHTWSHPDITRLSDKALALELGRNDRFLANTYGVSAKPFFRPPFGYRNRRSDKVCSDLGYSTQVMWTGSFGDSSLLTEGQLLALARQWLGAGRVVIGHANHPTVTRLYSQILEILRSRGLATVTLDDVFYAGTTRNKKAAAEPNPLPGESITPSPRSSPSPSASLSQTDSRSRTPSPHAVSPRAPASPHTTAPSNFDGKTL